MQKIITGGFVFFITLGANAQSVSLNVGGTIACEQKLTPRGAAVSVIRDGKPFTSFPISAEGTYHLYLPMGSEFVVTVSKKGYATKFFMVNTKGVSEESAKKKFSVIVADLEMVEYVEGVDYSIFNKPMNKYYYNPKTDNFEYDKEYLKNMLALVAEVKEAKKEAMALAKIKEEQEKKEAELAAQKNLANERLAMQKAALKKLEQEIQESKTAIPDKIVSAATPETKPVVADALKVSSHKDSRVSALLIKYQSGVTEEVIVGKNVIIIQRVLVRNEMAWVYQKKIFNWGGVAFFRDGVAITESIFELETKKIS